MGYVMRTVVKVRAAEVNGRAAHWVLLECGHTETPLWNGKTHYIEGETKSRCYKCAQESVLKSFGFGESNE